MIQILAADTWGISSPDFLRFYAVVGIAATAITGANYLLTVNARKEADSSNLSPTEIGMLVHDRRAILAAVTTLRAARLIDKAGVKRATGVSTQSRLDTLTAAVQDLCARPQPKLISSLAVDAQADLDKLRQRLIDKNLLCGPEIRTRVRLGVTPILAVVLLGIARLVAGVNNGKPVGVLVLMIGVLGVVTICFLRVPRRTRAGTEAYMAAKVGNRHLDPSKRPSLSTYGPTHAGIAAALFGGAALWALDPKLAAASSIPQHVDQSTHPGGWSSGGCGGGGGGGGCGGGCGG